MIEPATFQEVERAYRQFMRDYAALVTANEGELFIPARDFRAIFLGAYNLGLTDEARRFRVELRRDDAVTDSELSEKWG